MCPSISNAPAVTHDGTHVGTHACHERDAASTLGYHVPGSFPCGEERAVHVYVIQALYAVEGVACAERGQDRRHPNAETTHSNAE